MILSSAGLRRAISALLASIWLETAVFAETIDPAPPDRTAIIPDSAMPVAGAENARVEPRNAMQITRRAPAKDVANYGLNSFQLPPPDLPDAPAHVADVTLRHISVTPPKSPLPFLPPPDLPEAAPSLALPAPTVTASIATLPALNLPPPDLPEAAPSLALPAPAVAASIATLPAPTLPPPDLPEIRPILPDPQGPANVLEPYLRAVLAERGGLTHPRIDRAVRTAIAAAYEARGFRPFWLTGENWTPAARQAMMRLRLADEDGLEASAYAMPEPVAAYGEEARLKVLAEADLRLTFAVVLYARDARGGRIHARRLSTMIDPTIVLPEPGAVLAEVAFSDNAGAALQNFNPRHEGYRRLRDKLAELRKAKSGAGLVLPEGADLRVGMVDSRVPALRAYFGISPLSETTYDNDLARAVALFQRERGLPTSGTLNRRTVAALRDMSGDRLIADIIANMERWRWLPNDLGGRHAIVNIPEFYVRVFDQGKVIYEARAIVGKPDTPTPIFSSEMSFMVVNPTWFVPPSILKKEFLPKLQQDPSYAERRGFVVTRNGSNISIRQPPGERNALGHLKFMFPNRHAVYLHDTPSRNLFGTDRRAYSHGCVRVDEPFRLAEILMNEPGRWSEKRLRGLVGHGERSLRLSQKMPIHLVYFTHYVDENGRLAIRDDLYGYHRRVLGALGLDT